MVYSPMGERYRRCRVAALLEIYVFQGAMERAATEGDNGLTPGMELGGEFPVMDIQSGEGGLLQVCLLRQLERYFHKDRRIEGKKYRDRQPEMQTELMTEILHTDRWKYRKKSQ